MLSSLSFPFTEWTHEILLKASLKSHMTPNNSHLVIYFRILNDTALSDEKQVLIKNALKLLFKYPKIYIQRLSFQSMSVYEPPEFQIIEKVAQKH